ncbi:hypothetical protein [Thermus sp.]
MRITLNLDPYLARYAEEVRARLGVSRSEVFAMALRELRKAELAAAYRELAQDQTFLSDPWLDSDLEEVLEESSWS